ncbi:FliH/SctL family protein [Roseisolibacter sp. H3M3-2]|uniref:FliH/SctL family protein n=1 Tax=Roseisolibacter sp. H3M3-2 TaxID=3031323 RepID=UPI0023DBAA02|nr:FliH/SctL family protein [Roseisolibacter sp. H3M3-2]MDF1504970.1 FliH/SctL family protein [Roseisolibacter sp. H3M3-2]
MSSSDPRRPAAVARGAVLSAADAAAVLGASGSAGAWRPLELADAAALPPAARALDAIGAFDSFDAETLAPADVFGHDAPALDGAFADALPDFLTTPDDDLALGLPPELSLARERAVRDDLAREFAEQVAAMTQRHEQELAETYAAGVEQGQAEGAAAAERMLASTMEALEAARAQLAALEDRWLANLDENVAVLAVGVARHVIGREIAADDALVRERVAQALAEFPLEQSLGVRVNPADLATLKAAFALAGAGPRELRWTADDRVARGGCLVEGRERIVDGRVDAALERVYRRLSGQHA